MIVECDQIAVPLVLWERASAGDADARHELRRLLNGLVLYMHALSVDPQVVHTLVTAREACTVLGDSLTLTLGFDH